MAGLPAPPVLVLTDRRHTARPLAAVVRAVLAAGGRWFVVREKDLADDALDALVADVVDLAAAARATVLVAGPAARAAAVARRAGAHGVHLPRDGDPALARAALGPDACIGLSAHDAAEVARAAAAGVDYVTLSPVFASPGKPGYGPPLGPVGLADVAAHAAVPVVALGGIATAADAAACRAAGAAGVAVMGAVARADDPGTVVAALVAGWSA